MLEKDFNELDNDYITLWSKFYLGCKVEDIKDYIETLAELGQKDSIACYYLLKRPGETNPKIDRMVADKSLDLTKHTYLCKLEREIANGENEEISPIYAEWKNAKTKFYEVSEIARFYEQKKNLYRSIVIENSLKLANTDFIKDVQNLVDETVEYSSDATNPLVDRVLNLQRTASWHNIYSVCFSGDSDKNFMLKYEIIKLLKSQLKELKKALLKDKDNIVLNYLFARQVYLLKDMGAGSRIGTGNWYAINAFKLCANRDLSQTLLNAYNKKQELKKGLVRKMYEEYAKELEEEENTSNTKTENVTDANVNDAKNSNF